MDQASLVTGLWSWLYLKNDEQIFACWCKFILQSYLIEFWVSVVSNRHSHLVHETLKSAVSKEQAYELRWFFTCWLQGNNFWLHWPCILYLWLLNASLLQLYLLDPWQQLEKSYEIKSFQTSILLYVGVFSGNWVIRFLWISTLY